MDFIVGYFFGLRNGIDFLGDKVYREYFFELYRVCQGYGYYD